MSYNVQLSSLPATVPTPLPSSVLSHNLYLRRLACPYLSPQPDPTQPYYNPYVTVDYMENVQSNDAVHFDSQGDRTGRGYQLVGQRYSQGRSQPYAAQVSQQLSFSANANPKSTDPQHSFFPAQWAAKNSANPAEPDQPHAAVRSLPVAATGESSVDQSDGIVECLPHLGRMN